MGESLARETAVLTSSAATRTILRRSIWTDLRTVASVDDVGVVGVPFQPTSHIGTYRPDLKPPATRVIERPPGQCSTDAVILVIPIHFGVDQDHQILGQLILDYADDFPVDLGLVAPLKQVVGDHQVHNLQLCQRIWRSVVRFHVTTADSHLQPDDPGVMPPS
jgi:hypothetical protein